VPFETGLAGLLVVAACVSALLPRDHRWLLTVGVVGAIGLGLATWLGYEYGEEGYENAWKWFPIVTFPLALSWSLGVFLGYVLRQALRLVRRPRS
jgi:hypothetical protein